MRVVSNKALRDFAVLHPPAEKPLQDWRKRIESNRFSSFGELKAVFGSVDKVGHYYVFDIAGNHYRLIAAIHFNTQTLYIRAVLTHADYDRWRP
ncbi:type II toxin-antitoxin system HigB family toxin [Methylocaldum sp.]|uniref:type II toxin-antitoxin system HigB family toxin n=1 Tax=Methylocaldum sp. TaxID=1969727 RepID=UPI002D5C40B5|nr:type II toxin-antitoxin system HigB family toxin [Methylocaldum sp.]HYE36762.1 type II toxin-antitoxin system HigB family toxin [Methylocaldum sp.]